MSHPPPPRSWPTPGPEFRGKFVSAPRPNVFVTGPAVVKDNAGEVIGSRSAVHDDIVDALAKCMSVIVFDGRESVVAAAYNHALDVAEKHVERALGRPSMPFPVTHFQPPGMITVREIRALMAFEICARCAREIPRDAVMQAKNGKLIIGEPFA